jgi:NAD(P)-dependent dehydrogenase (short-subunit alcohol dehydrogenase family)
MPPSTALVLGTGGLGTALTHALSAQHSQVLSLGRRSTPAIDYANEASLAQAAAWTAAQCALAPLRLLVVATGFLHGEAGQPERSWAQLQAGYLSEVFWVNAIGPALVMKHFLPLLPRQGHCAAVFLSAKVGSIGDNGLGGWYGYRAAKAALNQLVKTASIEQARRNREAAIVALHPGTVATPLSEPFSKNGLNVRPPEVAAAEIAQVLNGLGPQDNGRFVDYQGQTLPW